MGITGERCRFGLLQAFYNIVSIHILSSYIKTSEPVCFRVLPAFFSCVGAAVLRIPVLYGEVEKLEESAVTVMFDKVQFSNKSANMDHWQQRFPTHVKDVAAVCRQLAEKRMLVSGFGRRTYLPSY